MKTRIGKYIVSEDAKSFSISYRYTFSDLIGSFWFLLMLSLGFFLLYTCYKTFTIDNLHDYSAWTVGIGGLGLSLFGAYLLAVGLYNPKKGIFRVNKLKQELKIVDFLKSVTIKLEELNSVYYEVKTSYKPKMKYAMLCIRLTDGTKKDCFIIRSSIPIDLGHKVDKDLNTISRQLRDKISQATRA